MTITKSDFDTYDWQSLVENSDRKDCTNYQQLFFKKAAELKEVNDEKGFEVFGLLGQLTMILLRLDKPDEPFHPAIVFSTGRTMAIEDLNDQTIETLKMLLPEIRDHEMQARIADVIWVASPKPDHNIGRVAMQSYLQAAKAFEQPFDWFQYFHRLERALQIAAKLGKNGDPYKETIKYIEDMIDKFHEYEGNDRWFSIRLMDLLLDQRQGDPTQYISITEKVAKNAVSSGDWRQARTAYEIKAKWHRLVKDEDAHRNALIQAAETYVVEADLATKRDEPSFMIAGKFIEDAIAAYREIGKAENRVTELHSQLLEYEAKIPSEMRPVSVSIPIDAATRQLYEDAQNTVRGLPFEDAILGLALIASPTPKIWLHDNAQSQIGTSISGLFEKGFFNDFGKVVAKRPSAKLNANTPDANEDFIQGEMFWHAIMRQQLSVVMRINPALSILTNGAGQLK